MTRAIILAAGRGSRMGKETEAKPKCLTLLKGKTLLEWQMSSLNKAGIQSVELVAGYKSELLQRFSSLIHINKNWANTNMVSSLFCAPDPKGDTIISYSDITYAHNHIIALKNSPNDIVITADLEWHKLWSLRFENPLDDAETFVCNNDNLLSIGSVANDASEIQAQFMGLIKLSQKGWEILHHSYQEFSNEEKKKLDMTSLLNYVLEKGMPIHIEFINGKWCECDTYSDVIKYENELLNNTNWLHDWR
jgi:L-glutamine-phosphate cytidylyltransferase